MYAIYVLVLLLGYSAVCAVVGAACIRLLLSREFSRSPKSDQPTPRLRRSAEAGEDGLAKAEARSQAVSSHDLKPDALARFANRAVALPTAFLLGIGVLGQLWLLVGLAALFELWVLGAIAAAGVALGGKAAYLMSRTFAASARAAVMDLRGLGAGWQLLAALTVTLHCAGVTTVGRSVEGDPSAFYLALPKVVVAAHRVRPLVGYETFTQLGLIGEMHGAALLALGSMEAARLFVWIAISAGAVMLVAICAAIGGGRRAQWLSAAMLLTSSAVIMVLGDGKVDLYGCALGLAAYYWALSAADDESVLAVVLAGAFTGFTVVAKLSYLPVLVPGVLLLVAWRTAASRRHSIVSALVRPAMALGCAVIAFAPNFLKNAIFYSNPIAPFGFGTTGWADQAWYSPEVTHRILTLYPFALTFGSFGPQLGNVSPLILGLLPFVLLLRRPGTLREWWQSQVVALGVTAVMGTVIWVVLRPAVLAPRYLLATLLLFAPVAATAVEGVMLRRPWRRVLERSVVLCACLTLASVLAASHNQFFFPTQALRTLTGSMAECDRDGTYCRAMEAINKDAAPGARVLLMTYHRLWLRPDLMQCVNSITDGNAPFVSGDEEARWRSIRKANFRYLLLDGSTHGAHLPPSDISIPPPWLPSWVKWTPLFGEGYVAVYRLEFTAAPVEPTTTCEPVGSAWQINYR